MKTRLRHPLTLAILPVLVLGIAFLVWTAATSAPLGAGHYDDPMNRLVDGFAQGHLYVLDKPDPRISRLPDPYDTSANAGFVTPAMRDLILHDGKLYPYWGPVPMLLAFWPFRALGQGDLSTGAATLVFSIVALVLMLGLLRLLLGRFLPATPPWAAAGGAAVLTAGSLLPWLLRRPEAYEVSIAAGLSFLWATALLLAVALTGDRLRGWVLAGAGLCAGLAFASRPPAGVAIVFVLLALLALRRTGRLPGRPEAVRAGVLLLAPLAVVFALLGLYNALRFGSPTDFGVQWLLTSRKNENLNSVSYMPAGLWGYLLYPPKLSPAFPFFWPGVPQIPFSIPDNYLGLEKTVGILPTVPFVLVLLAARPALRGAARSLVVAVAVLAGAGCALVLFHSFYYWGTIERYMADWASMLVLAAVLVWCALAAQRRRTTGARALVGAGGALAAASIVVATAIAFIGADDRLRTRHPGTYASLERFFSPVSGTMAAAAGHPVLSSVGGNALVGTVRFDRLGVSPSSFFLGTGPYPVQVAVGGRGPAVLEATIRRLPATPAAKLVVESRSPDGSVYSVPVDGPRIEVPVSLRFGANAITLQLFADPAGGIPEYADSPDDGAPRIEGLRVRSGRPG